MSSSIDDDSHTHIVVPEISDERLAELSVKIRQVALFAPDFENNDKLAYVDYRLPRVGSLYYTKPIDWRTSVLCWDPQPDKPADDIVEWIKTLIYHEYSVPNLHEPTTAEVLAQLQLHENILDEVVAFELLKARTLRGVEYHQDTYMLYKKA